MERLDFGLDWMTKLEKIVSYSIKETRLVRILTDTIFANMLHACKTKAKQSKPDAIKEKTRQTLTLPIDHFKGITIFPHLFDTNDF